MIITMAAIGFVAFFALVVCYALTLAKFLSDMDDLIDARWIRIHKQWMRLAKSRSASDECRREAEKSRKWLEDRGIDY